MTWEQLMGKIREGLTESGARLRVLGDLLADGTENGKLLNRVQINTVVIGLAVTMSDLHSTVEHLTIGLDAVVETLRNGDKSQEVKHE